MKNIVFTLGASVHLSPPITKYNWGGEEDVGGLEVAVDQSPCLVYVGQTLSNMMSSEEALLSLTLTLIVIIQIQKLKTFS